MAKRSLTEEFIVPLTELHETLDEWIYDDAPFLLGYAVVGLQVELATIQKGEKGKSNCSSDRTLCFGLTRWSTPTLFGNTVLNLSTLFRPLVDKVRKAFFLS